MAEEYIPPSDGTTSIKIVYPEGSNVPTLGYGGEGADYSMTKNPDGSYTLTALFAPQDGTFVSVTGSYSSFSTAPYVEPEVIEVGPTAVPNPPSIYSNDYAAWLETYTPVDPPPDPVPILRSITGTITDQNGNPLECDVICRIRETDAIVGETTSSPIDGTYEVDCYTIIEHYITIIYNEIYVMVKDKVICLPDDSWNFTYATIDGTQDWKLPFPVGLTGDFYQGVFIREDGAKAWAVTEYAKEIVEFTLTTANDLDTAAFVQSKSLTISGTSDEYAGVHWKANGLSFFIVHGGSTDVYEFTCSSAWDISTASSTANWSNNALPFDGSQLHITPDGLSITGIDTINTTAYLKQYTLSTGWDLYPVSYQGIAYSDGSSGYHYPRYVGMAWLDSGDILLSQASRHNAIYSFDTSGNPYNITEATEANMTEFANTVADDARIFLTSPDGTTLYTFSNDRGDSYKTGNHYYKGTMSTPGDVSTLTYDIKHVFTVDAATSNASVYTALFDPTGTKLSMIDATENTTYFELSTPWELDTATLIRSSTTAWDSFSINNPWDAAFNGDGTVVYVSDDTGTRIDKIDLSTPYDFTSATARTDTRLYNINGASFDWFKGISFNSDGTLLYLLDINQRNLISVPLATPYLITVDVLDTEFANVKFFYYTSFVSCTGLFVSPDGKRIYTMHTDGTLRYIKMTTADDVDTAAYEDSYDIQYLGYYNPYKATPSPDGMRLYVDSGSCLIQHDIIV